jgi:hypothetical protein
MTATQVLPRASKTFFLQFHLFLFFYFTYSFPSCVWYTASPSYLSSHRVHHEASHFVHLMPTKKLEDTMFKPFQGHALYLPLSAVDV